MPNLWKQNGYTDTYDIFYTWADSMLLLPVLRLFLALANPTNLMAYLSNYLSSYKDLRDKLSLTCLDIMRHYFRRI